MPVYRARPAGWNEVLTDAETWDHDPYSGPTDWVEGELVVLPVTTLWGGSYTQHRIGNVQVDPATVERLPGPP